MPDPLDQRASASGRVAASSAPTARPPEPEWLDRPDLSAADRRRGISDLRRVNRFLFGRRPVVESALHELGDARGRQRLLDVAAGAGDVSAAIARAARGRQVDLEVVALDREIAHLALGRRSGDVAAAVVADAEALPFRDGAFDLSLSSLFFHHLDPAGKASVAAEMRRVARRGAVIVDLIRTRWAVAALRLLFPLLGIGRIAREDGLASIARASTLDEWRQCFAGSGAEVRRRFPSRVAIVLRGPAPAPGSR
jgi:SAM-dependent methyltransferase